MLLGLVLGAMGSDYPLDPFSGAAIGGAVGWVLGMSIHVWQLRRKSARQSEQLEVMQKTVEALQQRLSMLEHPPTSSFNKAAASQPVQDSAPLPDTIWVASKADEPELSWDLPAEVAVAPTPEPVASDWNIDAVSPSRAQSPAAPTPVNWLDRGLDAAKGWLLGGNTVLRVGVVLLFLGLAFLLRYATEGMVIPVEAKYAAVIICALALLGLGWWLRGRNPAYALTLQGASVGVIYLTIFAAMKLNALIDPAMGFALLVAVTAFSAILAVKQDSLALACAGALGGFAAPLLASTGQGGNHIALFSYFTLLNAGIFAIAWFKAWRPLNLIGFFGTFGIGAAWGMKAYNPELLWSTEGFLILFFLMYLAIGLLFARRRLEELASGPEDDSRTAMLRWSARQSSYVDGSLLFGTPIVGFGLQYALVGHLEFGAAISALVLGLIYMGIARLLASRTSGRALLLVETCLALGVVFATLAIPLGLNSQWTSVSWAIEGAAAFWLGLRQNRMLARAFGLLLQIGAGLAFINELNAWYSPLFAHGDYWTPMILSLAALISALCVERIRTASLLNRDLLSTLLLVWGGAWWGVGLISASWRLAPPDLRVVLLLALAAASLALWTVISVRLRWPGLAMLCLALLGLALIPVSGILLAYKFGPDYHPSANWGWLAWLVLFAVHLRSLRSLEQILPAKAASIAHVLGCWLILSVVALQVRDVVMAFSETYNAWRWLGWALVPSLYLLAMAAPRQWPWPVATHGREYRVWAALPVAGLLLAWFWLANTFSDGNADPLGYVPLVNPLEIGLLFALTGVFLWISRNLHQLGVSQHQCQRLAWLVAGASLFALVTAMVMRTAHHWSGVPWAADDLLESMRVQAGLSIVWTLMALALMIGGHLRVRREIWIAGAVLIGVVVAKLFFVELSNRGGMARIVSFIGVGILLLVVGYFAPLPPKRAAQATVEPTPEPDLP
jgi:uncharacterized membrane protein